MLIVSLGWADFVKRLSYGLLENSRLFVVVLCELHAGGLCLSAVVLADCGCL